MSFASAQKVFPPLVASVAAQTLIASGADPTFFNDLLPVGSYIITGVVNILSGGNLDNVYVSALNGLGPSKIVLFGIESTALDSIFAPFTICYYSNGVDICDISVQVATAGAAVWSISAASKVQIQRLS